MKFFKKNTLFILLFLPLLTGNYILAHPMSNSVVVLNVHEKHISGQILLPLSELESAMGMSINENSDRLVERLGDTLRFYLRQHIRPKSLEGKPWEVRLGGMKVEKAIDQILGEYQELVVLFEMTPPDNYDLRNFYFDYDVILHQVASHKTLIQVKQDWLQGIVNEDTTTLQVGVIEWDIVNNKLSPFQVSLKQGSRWQGFLSMVKLGIQHIAEGTDHLLFLLVLLLPALQIVQNKRWNGFNGIKKSFFKIIKIVTSFTIGHSLTLLLGAMGWVNFPSQPIEILIALSIMVSAIHAIKPIFTEREIYLAAGFGLVHGLAFAHTIIDLALPTSHFVLSIFGFNLGVEIFQIIVIISLFPILYLIATKTTQYNLFRTTGAVLAMLASFYWLFERL
jgi:hypothetical protein